MEKKNILISKRMNKFFKIKLPHNRKAPPCSGWTQGTGNIQGTISGNHGIRTGKLNNLTVIDLDFKPSPSHMMYKYLTKTLSVQTRKGYHLYFNYNKKFGNSTNKNFNIDIRNDNGYVVAPGSKVNKSTYVIHNKSNMIDMTDEIEQYIIENKISKVKGEDDKVQLKVGKEKKKNTKSKSIKGEQVNTIKAMLPNIMNVLKNLPDKYIENFSDWFKFTTFCQILDLKNEWLKISQKWTQWGEYTADRNEYYWNNTKSSCDVINLILKECKFKNPLNAKYKDNEDDIIYNDFINRKTIHIDKLNKAINFNNIKKKVVVSQSDTGTGKTTCTIDYLNDTGSNYISIVSRRALANDQWKRLPNGGVCSTMWDKTKFPKYDPENPYNIITTIESCGKIRTDEEWGDLSIYKDCTLILDEFNSLLVHTLFSSTLKNNRESCFSILIELIKTCKKVICIDADINEISLKFLYDTIENNDIMFIKNTFLHNRNITANISNDYEKLIGNIKEQKKFIICTDSLEEARLAYDMLDDEDIKMITGDTDNQDIDLNDHDKIIYSPSVIYGLDSKIRRKVYAIFTGKSINSSSMIQQIARTRDIIDLTIMFIRKKYKPAVYDNLADCVTNIKSVVNQTLNAFGFRRRKHYKLYYETYGYYEYLADINNTNKYIHLLKLLEKRGFKINYTNFSKNVVNRKKVDKERKLEMLKKHLNFDSYSMTKDLIYWGIDKDLFFKFIDTMKSNTSRNQHKNYCKYFFDKSVILSQKGEYGPELCRSDEFKMKFLIEIEKNLTIPNNPEPATGQKIKDWVKKLEFFKYNDTTYDEEHFSKCFKHACRSKMAFTKDNYIKCYIKLCRVIFGADSITTVKRQENGKRIQKYYFSKEAEVKHKTFYAFRNKEEENDEEEEYDVEANEEEADEEEADEDIILVKHIFSKL